ncbi:hypothetical protein [uncultured Sphingomonas sp.]|uniref:hypothetical protein n=1 Tax=uncultured Sphingomonas sp. TaxID=158754 RepID=UPI0025CD1EA6|nr:hypothetical protein [uncultured Sphingomonas sp.]
MMSGIHERVRSLTVTLWTLIVPPTTWAAHFLFSYLWAAVRCAKLGSFATEPGLFWGGTAVAVAVILAAGWMAWVQSRTPGSHPPHEEGTEVDRLRFLAYSTLLLAGLSLIGVAFTAMPVLFITDCR